MNRQTYNRLIAIFSALVLMMAVGACRDSGSTLDSSEPIPPTTQPTGGGPGDPSNATGGSGTTTSDPSTEPTGGGPAGVDAPETQPSDDSMMPGGSMETQPGGTTQPGVQPGDSTMPGGTQPGTQPPDSTMPGGTQPETQPPGSTMPGTDSATDPTGGGPTGIDETNQNMDQPDSGQIQTQ